MPTFLNNENDLLGDPVLMPIDDDPRYVEQGLRVFQVSDYESIAAGTFDEAWAYVLVQWGFTDPAEIAEHEEGIPFREPCDLDTNKLSSSGEDGSGPPCTYREWLRTMIAHPGASFPDYFAAYE